MALVLHSIYDIIIRLDAEHRDLRTEHMLLMGHPWKIIAITIAYYLFIQKIGPSIMKNRQPYELKNLMLLYNLGQVIFNLYLAIIGTKPYLYFENYADGSCMTADLTNTPKGMFEITFGHYYYLLKVVDYMDTIFFVLRKRYKQVTFLHVYHHIFMALLSWFAMRYVGGGHPAMIAYLNVWVHTVMYFYYFIAALRPEMKNSIWWKKYITQMQILQFLILIVHFARAVLNPNCGRRVLHTFGLLQAVFMFLMFVDFYYKAYTRMSRKDKK